MTHYFVCAVFSDSECFFDCFNSMASVSVSGNIFVDALYTDFQASTPIGKHISKVPFAAEVRPCFDGNADTLGLALFGKLHSLVVV